MAKGTNMSKCLGTEFACKKETRYESIVKVGRALTNSGFTIDFEVDCTGFRPEKEQIKVLSDYLSSCLKKGLVRIISEFNLKNLQKEFDF